MQYAWESSGLPCIRLLTRLNFNEILYHIYGRQSWVFFFSPAYETYLFWNEQNENTWLKIGFVDNFLGQNFDL